MTELFRKRAEILNKKIELYKLLLEIDPELITDEEVDLMHILSEDKQIQRVLVLKAKVHEN